MQKLHGKFYVYKELCYRGKIKKFSSQQNNFVKITTQMDPILKSYIAYMLFSLKKKAGKIFIKSVSLTKLEP